MTHNATASMLAGLGACVSGLRWAVSLGEAGEDLRVAWDRCDSADDLAWFLVTIGFPFDDVVQTVLDLCDGPYLALSLRRCLEMRTGKAAGRLAEAFCRETGVPSSDLADALRSAFDFEEVLDALGSKLGFRSTVVGPTIPRVQVERLTAMVSGFEAELRLALLGLGPDAPWTSDPAWRSVLRLETEVHRCRQALEEGVAHGRTAT